MAGKNTTISTVQPMAGNLRIQTAVYGAVIALVYGRTRISGNLGWYGGFKAIPHTSTTTSGGKGGGGKVTQSQTDFTYAAALLMILGEGVINGVRSVWKGKTKYSGVPTASTPVTLTSTFLVPSMTPINVTGWVADVSVDDNVPYNGYYGNSGDWGNN